MRQEGGVRVCGWTTGFELMAAVTRFERVILESKSNVMPFDDTASWWIFRDSNPGPIGYEPTALTD